MSADTKRNSRYSVTVMTQNLYFGAELTPIFAATNPAHLIAGIATAWAQVEASGIEQRAALVAEEIAASKPDLVGLQEVAQWSVGASGAMVIKYDFLEVILRTLLEHGVFYVPLAVKNDLDQTAPLDAAGTLVRIVDRDVVLLRISLPSAQVRPYNVQTKTYSTLFQIPNPLFGSLRAPRSWIAVDANIDDRRFRFIETHLESFSAEVQLAQAEELLAGPGNTALPLILAGDFNSNANSRPGDPPSESNTPTYPKLIANGLRDVWTITNRGDPGNTGCQQPDLRNPVSQLSERIDLLLTRGGVTPVKAKLAGDKPSSRTSSGLWPSDHAGLVATLEIPA
jgi:endonuclease/exonuclease/phosphatase family metal-dependent hydrolase